MVFLIFMQFAIIKFKNIYILNIYNIEIFQKKKNNWMEPRNLTYKNQTLTLAVTQIHGNLRVPNVFQTT